jgi:signal recognition particle subunit SRP54
MFDSLSGKLQNAFRNLRGLGKISESNAGDALREVRMALLEADVNFKVARDFIERVKTKALGAEVVASVQPGHQIVKIISDELTDLLGSTNAALNLSGNPACVMMVGLHGAGAWRGQNHFVRQARQIIAKAGPHTVAGRGGCLSSGGDGSIGNTRQTD